MIPGTCHAAGVAPPFLDVGVQRHPTPTPSSAKAGSEDQRDDDPLGAGSCWPGAHSDFPIFRGVLINRAEECKIEEKAK